MIFSSLDWASRKPLLYQELQLLTVIFTKHPKSGEAWSHRCGRTRQTSTRLRTSGAYTLVFCSVRRRWILLQVFEDIKSSLYVSDVFQNELRVCTLLAERYPRNYYAWYGCVCGLERELMRCEYQVPSAMAG